MNTDKTEKKPAYMLGVRIGDDLRRQLLQIAETEQRSLSGAVRVMLGWAIANYDSRNRGG